MSEFSLLQLICQAGHFLEKLKTPDVCQRACSHIGVSSHVSLYDSENCYYRTPQHYLGNHTVASRESRVSRPSTSGLGSTSWVLCASSNDAEAVQVAQKPTLLLLLNGVGPSSVPLEQ